ncbi:MAG: hypothetical protein ABSC26_11890, partial [Stellaceae bacterium]
IEIEPPAAPIVIVPSPAAESEATNGNSAAAPNNAAAEPAPSPVAAPVIPLVHAPDDPGPEIVEDSDTGDDAKPGIWRKIFGSAKMM